MAKVRSARDIEGVRAAGQLAALTLRHVAPLVRPGVSTEEINHAAHDFIVGHGAYPSPLHYRGFPKSVCTSINDVVCHGIPSYDVFLAEGDIVNIDVTVTLDGFFGDTSITFGVGQTLPPERAHVRDISAECLARSLAVVRHGARMGDIGHAIQSYAEDNGCGVERDFVGHGICRGFHDEPVVPHYGQANSGIKLVRGMIFTIEPMINGGDYRHRILADGWTAVTVDGKPSAQFEHTIALVGDGIEVLTALPDDPIVARARELGGTILWPGQ